MSKSSIIKIFIFAVLLLIFAFLFWRQLADIYLKRNLHWRSLLWLGIWLLIFLVFWLIFSLLVESKMICFSIYLLILAIFFLFFNFHYYLLIGLVVLFVGFVISRALIQKERNNRLKISLNSIFKSGLKLNLFFLALFLSLLSYFYPLVKSDELEINLPPKVLSWISKPLTKTFSGFDPEMTIDEMLKVSVVIEKPDLTAFPPELIKKFKDKNLKSFNPQELLKDSEIAEIIKDQAKKVNPQIINKERDELAKKLGLTLTGNEKLSEVIGKLVNKKLKELLGSYSKYLPIISAILIFLVLKIIFVPFSWLVILITLLIFLIFLIFRLVRIEKVMKEGEDIKL
ncbi:MAG: hypothetical protein ACK413_00470 [Patescibacteria group bacterium]